MCVIIKGPKKRVVELSENVRKRRKKPTFLKQSDLNRQSPTYTKTDGWDRHGA